MKKIVHVVDIPAATQNVYEAITTESGLASWWTTDVTADMRPGGELEFRFGDVFSPTMTVTSLDENEAVRWRCIGGNNEAWIDSTIAFVLTDVEDKTRLVFTHEYANDLPDEVIGMFNFNWGYYLDSLSMYCETGTGKPFAMG